MTSATTLATAAATTTTTTGALHANHRNRPINITTTRGVSDLMYACQQGDVDRVRKIVHAQHSLLWGQDRRGKTALHYCCTSDHICAAQAADLLVMAAPDLVDGRDEDGFTPLHLAVIAGNMPLVTFLLANHADVNAVDNEKHTVVHWATVCGETAALRAVLAAGAPVSTPDVHGGYPLHYAAQMCGGERDSNLGIQVLQILLTHSDIVVSVEDGDGRQPLLWAASAGSSKAVLALIRAGAHIEAPDKDGLTALHCAASRGHTNCIDSLLTLCGASPDVIDSNGCTALHYAVTLGHADATALLLAHGADPNRQDRKGRSPAHCGCAKGQFETVKMIGAHGANLWLRNARGDLPLHEAAGSGRRDLVKWLLEMRPSQVNARNNDGRCPLHLAALNDNSDMCKILLDAGAQVNPILRTSKNHFMTPLDCALQRGFRSTAKYLQLHGGVPANRLGDLRFGKNGNGINLQIRDDITFWGDTSSDSERENGENNKINKKTQRKKLSHKFEKKKSLSGSDLENNKLSANIKANRKIVEKTRRGKLSSGRADSAISVIDNSKINGKKAPSGRYDYTNEIVINGKTEINIHHTKQINIGKDIVGEEGTALKTEEIIQNEVLIEKDKRPKSAKYSKVRDKSGKVSAKQSSARRKEAEIQEKSETQQTPKYKKDQVNQIKKEKSAAKVSSTNKSVEVAAEKESKTGPDQQSLISYTSEDVEVHKSMLVEASVHEPPKELSDKANNNPEQDISNNIENKQDVNISEIAKNADVVTDENQTPIIIPEEKSQLKTSELKDTEQIEENGKQAILCTNDLDVIKTESTDLQLDQQLNEETGEHISQIKTEEIMKSIENYQQITNANVETNVENFITIQEDKIEQAQNAVLENANNKTDIEQIEQKEDAIEKKEDMIEKKEDAIEKKEDVIEKKEDAIEKKEEININDVKDDVNLSMKVEHVDNVGTLEDNKNKIETNVDINNQSSDTEILELKSEKHDLPKITKTERVTTAPEQQAINEEIEVVQNKPDSKTNKKKKKKNKTLQSTELSKPDEMPEEKSTKSIQQRKKWEKKKAYEIIDKSFEDEEQSVQDTPEAVKSAKASADDLTSDSETSSSTLKQHKSFRVLEEQNLKLQKKSLLRKQRSRSEENEEQRVKEKKRSKIPTLLDKSKLSKSDKYLDIPDRKTKSSIESRVPSLPNIHVNRDKGKDPPRSDSNMSAPLLASVCSDNERGSGSELDAEEEENKRTSALRKRKVKRRSKTRDARSAGSDYESSNVIDSGFEPSPRSTRIPRLKHVSDRGVNMTSVTQSIQTNIRRYHMERKIFQQLLELKRMQIRSGQHNEAMLVKRAIDAYNNSCTSTVGAGKYAPEDYSFKNFEKFLYTALRKLQKNGADYMKDLPETPINPLLCTKSTHRCMHATHAYTGIPCAAYLPMMDHHTMPKIGFNSSIQCKPGTRFLPNINQKKAVTLELSHGTDKQIISLPADRLDQNKRYYVTFTVKGNEDTVQEDTTGHTHSKSD